MKVAALVLLGWLILCPEINAQKTVWTSEDLKKVEIETWFDLFSLSSNWVNASVDDANIQHSMNGLAGVGGAWWGVYVNGIKLNTQAWDSQSPHLIPFSISQADSVVIIEEPMLYDGVFTEKGGIFIYTKKMQEGWSVDGNFSFGNNSGDPGPFLYTEYASQNVERVGPVADAQLMYKTNNLRLKVGGSLFYHSLTDNHLTYRRLVPFEYGGHPYRQVKIISNNAFTEADLAIGNSTHKILAGGSSTEDYLFSNIYGVEIPVERTFGFAAYLGEIELSDKVNFSYQVARNYQNTEHFPNKDNRWLQWRQDVSSAKGMIQHDYKRGVQTAGVEAEYINLNNDLSGNNLSEKIFGMFYSNAFQINDWMNFRYEGKLSITERIASKNKAKLRFQVASNHTIELSGTYSERLPAEDNSMWYWVAEKGFASDTIGAEAFTSLPNKSIYKRANLSWISSFKETEVLISAQLMEHQNEYVLDYRLSGKGLSTTVGSINYLNDFDASYFRIPVQLKNSFFDNLDQVLSYTFTQELSANSEIFNIPIHRFSYHLNWKPVESFKVWTRIQSQSEIEWRPVQPIDGREIIWTRFDGEIRNTYHANTDARFILDIGIKKYFWDQRMAFSLDMRNITDQHFKYHPLSQTHRLTLFLKAHLNLPRG